MRKTCYIAALCAIFWTGAAQAQLVPWWQQLPQQNSYQPNPYSAVMQNYAAPQRWSGQRVGNFDYWSSTNGQRITCQHVGQYTYCQ